MREGSLDAPIRHPLSWDDPAFYDETQLDAEMRRVFDICHGCRRCFNLCDSFPRLFDLIDASSSGELDTVESKDFKPIVDACTLCDMCFMTKCPYVPPHAFDLDFPHLMLRAKAVQTRKGETSFGKRQLAETDRNNKLATAVAPLVNWATSLDNHLTRPLVEKVSGIDQRAVLPQFHGKTLVKQVEEAKLQPNREAPAYGRKAVIYATCFGNYNDPQFGMTALKVLAHNGIETEVLYPECCGMPHLEQGAVERVASKAERIATMLLPWVDKGYDIVALIPSCALMLKFEWPLLIPGSADVRAVSAATFDLSEYLIDIGKKEGLTPGLQPIEGGVSIHIACHARAQNMGQKGAEMLRLIPGLDVHVVERCSGHGGTWGMMKDNFETALKVGKPVARQVEQKGNTIAVSECPLAAIHIKQGVSFLNPEKQLESVNHPVEILARAYGF